MATPELLIVAKRSVVSAVVLACVALAFSATAHATQYVNGLGVNGWVSNDTRSPTGQTGTNVSADQIAKQIQFMGEGVVSPDAAGANPDPSPTGSLNGFGYVRLDGTNDNRGKSDLSYIDYSGIAATSALLGNDFLLTYRAFSDPNTTNRTIGLNIELSNTGSTGYIFNHVNASNNANTWLDESVSTNSGLFYLYGTGALGAAPGGSGAMKTLAEWAADSAWSALFGGEYDVVRIGFNIGSYQRNALVYLDWMETNLLYAGERVDFASSSTVPEPSTFALFGLAVGLGGVVAARRRMTGR
jgi:hypothetical protein